MLLGWIYRVTASAATQPSPVTYTAHHITSASNMSKNHAVDIAQLHAKLKFSMKILDRGGSNQFKYVLDDQGLILAAHPTGSPEVRAAARTLSRAFSRDPLISWLYRPGARTWSELDPVTQVWQERRVAHAAATRMAVAAMGSNPDGDEDCLGMMIITPPDVHHWQWWLSPRRWRDLLRLKIETLLDRSEEQSCDRTVRFPSHSLPAFPMRPYGEQATFTALTYASARNYHVLPPHADDEGECV